MAIGDANWNDRRITTDKPKKDDRVLSVLRQIEDMKYANFMEMADVFGMESEELHSKIKREIIKRQEKNK